MSMNMNRHEIGRKVVAVGDYGDEVRCAGWNPQLALANEQPVTVDDKHAALTGELANIDVDAFPQKR